MEGGWGWGGGYAGVVLDAFWDDGVYGEEVVLVFGGHCFFGFFLAGGGGE